MVLSGCETRVGMTGLQEHGYGSLHRAMLVAGSESVIASRWQVGDETTYALMTNLYKRYPGMGRAVALAQAQRQMIASTRVADTLTRKPTKPHFVFSESDASSQVQEEKIPYAAPWSWAAFTVVGRWD